jgi:hypothetical protein
MIGRFAVAPQSLHPVSQYANSGSSGVSLSSTVLMIMLLAGAIFVFRKFLLPTIQSTISGVKQLFGSPTGRIVGVIGAVVLGLLFFGAL